jgi:hypothetical protein
MPAAAAAEKSFVVKTKEKAVESINISARVHGQLDALSTSYKLAADPGSESNLFRRRVCIGLSAGSANG